LQWWKAVVFADTASTEVSKKKEKKMSDETERGKPFVRVKDAAGNDWLCPLDALMDPKDASDEELNSCVDDATVGRYAGDIKVVD
jgi:hypothetical protein